MKNFLFIIIIGISIPECFGQSQPFARGFPNVDLTQVPMVVVQDTTGFLWVGTTDGLFRYDGKTIVEFRRIPDDTLSLSDNYIRSLSVDKDNNIWIGTNDGVNIYESASESITRLDLELRSEEDVDRVLNLLVDSKDRIWIGTYNGLFKYTRSNNKLEHFLPGENKTNSLVNKLVWNIFEDSQDRLWISTDNGFTVFDNDDQYNFKSHEAQPSNPKDLFADAVFEIGESADATFWMATYDGLFKVTEVEEGYSFEHFQKDRNSPLRLSENQVFNLFVEEQKVWAGTFSGGLDELTLDGGDVASIIHYTEDSNSKKSISFNRVHNVFRDQSDVLWVSTATGMDKISPYVNKFKNILANVGEPNGFSDRIVRSTFKDSYGNHWVGTRNGLNLLRIENQSKENSEWEKFYAGPNSLSYNRVESIYEDAQQYLWIATISGLTYFHIPTFLRDGKMYQITSKQGIPHTYCTGIIQIEKGEYLLGSIGAFSRMYFDGNLESIRFQEFVMDKNNPGAIVNNSCRAIIDDRDSSFWIGTFNGLSNFIPGEIPEKFINYTNDKNDINSLSNNTIMCLYRDSKDRIWVGTRGGLNLVRKGADGERASFIRYGIKDGLPNDIIFSIEESEDGTFWVNTNKGLSHLDFDAEQIVLRTYNELDGIVGSNAVYRSSMKDENGNIYFGAPGGINYFHPDELVSNPKPPKVIFTKLEINNEESVIGSEVLDKSVSIVDSIRLRHGQNNIALEFAALDYNQPEQNNYRYYLSGVTENIVDNGTNNRIMFNNLTSGTHKLSVWGSNNDGVWSEQPRDLYITVYPPWWESTWAYIFYVLTVLGLIYGWLRYKLSVQAKKIKAKLAMERIRQEEREIIRMNNAADFHDELGNKITKVSLYLSLAERSIDNNEVPKEWLTKIRTTLSDLSGGFRDLLWVIDPHKDSLYETTLRIKEFGHDLFENADIEFSSSGIDSELEHVQLDAMVKKNIVMIFKEAFHNGLKYSEAKHISFSVNQKENEIEISYKDDGKGFDLSQKSNGRGIKNLSMRADKIKAELQIITAPGEGTKITLKRLPHMGYA